MGVDDLQRAVFCLRGGVEFRDVSVKDGYHYTETASKNRAGGLAQEHKTVFIAEVPERSLLDKYTSKLPNKTDGPPILLPGTTQLQSEKNKLYKMVNDMCEHGQVEQRNM